MIGVDALTGPRPALVAEDVERLVRAMDSRRHRGRNDYGTAGIAEAFGITVKTLYRYWPGRVEWVEVDGYPLAFLCRPGHRPVLLDTRRASRELLSAKLP